MHQDLEPELLILLHALRDNDAVFQRLADRAKWLDIERDRVIDALDAEERAARENRRRIAQVLIDAGIMEAQVQWGEKRYALKSGYLAEQPPAPRVLTISAAPTVTHVQAPAHDGPWRAGARSTAAVENPAPPGDRAGGTLSPQLAPGGPCRDGDGETDVETPGRAPASP